MSIPGEIHLITGIMAAGKSTIAQALAARLPLSVHLRGDLFRRMIVNGREPITAENWSAAERQIHLRQDIATAAAITYADAGYTVCYQDVILGADLSRVVQLLGPGQRPVSVIVLVPDTRTVAQRDRDRPKTGYVEWTPDALDHSVRTGTPRLGLWLDTSNMSIAETVDTILANREVARVQQ